VPDVSEVQNEDLVLKINPAVDPAVFDETKYEAFLDVLCETREYQKDAIRTTLRYLLGGQYPNLQALVRENFKRNAALQELYDRVECLEQRLLYPNRLSASLDLATGTGKSYVLYGIAAIMLAEGAVDQALVLCPSLTIEAGLKEKFQALAVSTDLSKLLPHDAVIRSPRITNANESIVAGTICIENYHAVLQNSRSSVRPTLVGKGSKTLILNDEVHHLYSGTGDMKRWAEFVGDPEYGFRYIIGASGTCYQGNDYFPDVIARYSLKQAIEAGFVKTIDYVVEDSPGGRDEKFQKIYDNHIYNKTQRYRKVKPLTILVTQNISGCKRLTEDLVDFLAAQEQITKEDAAKKVLAVTSDPSHLANVTQLPLVDRSDNPVEWITSVSMLTEGWDVKNVFQIVPHEERAFSSKLLIAQVLGRGLRIPDEYRGERPVVIVFNHDAWSSRIKHLVDEVLEIESRLYSEIVAKPTDYNFDLVNINYTKTQQIEEYKGKDEVEFTKGYVSLASQAEQLERETTYARAVSGSRRQKRTLIRYQMHSVDDVAEHIHRKLKAIDEEVGTTTYATKYSIDWLRELIRKSLRRVGEKEDRVSEENRQRLQNAFGVVHRKSSQTVRYTMSPNPLVAISTRQRKRDSVGVSALRRQDATVFFDEYALTLSDEGTRAVLAAIRDDESLPPSAYQEISNSFYFKTPQNLVIANHEPERRFISKLVEKENAEALSGWIKSTETDFYRIEFSWRKGEHVKRGYFNPDFFLCVGGIIFVVEIKADEERENPSEENRAKFKAATEHFATVNQMAEEHEYRFKYRFNFLTPRDYDAFFQFLRDGRSPYISSLDAVLSNGAQEEP
jgi:type III restriction enzyme